MLETFQSRNSRDFRQRYQNSWGYFKTESGEKLLVFMSDISDSRAGFTDSRGAKYVARADADVEFEFIPVRKRLFIHQDTLHYVTRVPARMFSRGVNNQNTSISTLPLSREVNLDFANIIAAFAKDHAPVAESHEKDAFTLSDTFGVTGDSLFVYNHKIGTWNRTTKQIKVEDKIFEQEVKDLLAKHLLPYTLTT